MRGRDRRIVSCTALAAIVSSLVAHGAFAQAVQVEDAGCERGVHLVARGAPASEVLTRLARAADFRLTVDEPITTPVTIDAVQPTYRLLTDLLGAQSVIITERADPKCPGRYRVAQVWVVRKATAETAAAAKKAMSSLVTPEAREQDLLYQRAHGMLPP